MNKGHVGPTPTALEAYARELRRARQNEVGKGEKAGKRPLESRRKGGFEDHRLDPPRETSLPGILPARLAFRRFQHVETLHAGPSTAPCRPTDPTLPFSRPRSLKRRLRISSSLKLAQTGSLGSEGYEIWADAVRAVLVPAEGKYEGTE